MRRQAFRGLLAAVVLFLSCIGAFADPWTRWSPTGSFTNASGTVFYLGTTNVAQGTTLVLNSTSFVLPADATMVRVYWKYTGSGATATNILYLGAASYGDKDNPNYDTYTSGLWSITSISTNAGTYQVSKEFEVRGVTAMKPIAIVPGASGGTTTNHFVDVSVSSK